MNGLVFNGPGDVQVRTDLAEPALEELDDAIIQVDAAGLCGSDLHSYLGREAAAAGVVPGHEAVGTVAAASKECEWTVGTRVIVPFTTNCGRCEPCRRSLSARCIRGQLFGWGDPASQSQSALPGLQAERARIPLASTTLVALPSGVSDEAGVLLSDNYPTAWVAVQRTSLVPGDRLAIFGLGSVGLCAVAAGLSLGAGEVVAIDPVADRREAAARLGATALHPDAADGLEAPVVVEAAGAQPAQRSAFEAVATGGAMSVIAVQTESAAPFSPVEAYDKNLSVSYGRAPVRSVLPGLLGLLAAGDIEIPADVIVTHPQTPFEAGPSRYGQFANRTDGVIKATFRP